MIKKPFHSVLIIALVSIVTGTIQSSFAFDCTKAKSIVEKEICKKPELKALDEKLNKEYSATLEKVPPDLKEEIKKGQRSWVSKREQSGKECLSPEERETTGSDCIQSMIQGRIELLKDYQERLKNKTAGRVLSGKLVYLILPDRIQVFQKDSPEKAKKPLYEFDSQSKNTCFGSPNCEQEIFPIAVTDSILAIADIGSSCGANCSSWADYTTIDVNTGKPVLVENLFTAEELMQGLKASAAINKDLTPQGKKKLDQIKTVREFFEKVNLYNQTNDEDPEKQNLFFKDADFINDNQIALVAGSYNSQFAFLDWKEGKVTLRLSLRGEGPARNVQVDLDLQVPSPEHLKEALKNATDKKEGFLFKDVPLTKNPSSK